MVNKKWETQAPTHGFFLKSKMILILFIIIYYFLLFFNHMKKLLLQNCGLINSYEELNRHEMK